MSTTTMQHQPAWLRGILQKRTPDALRILGDLVEAGLKKGHCSANDIIHRDLDEPNIIGSVFKTLKGLGFRQSDYREEARYKSQHGRKVFRWVLEDGTRARQFLREVGGIAFGFSQGDKQGNLF